MDELEEKVKAIAEHYGNDLSAFLRDAYQTPPQLLPEGEQCGYDYSWCIARRQKDEYCFYHWLEEELYKEREESQCMVGGHPPDCRGHLGGKK